MVGDEQKGLYGKYSVQRVNDPTSKHADCKYFVLDLTHDRFARLAALYYADECAAEFPQLASDLRSLAETEHRKANTFARDTSSEHEDANAKRSE